MIKASLLRGDTKLRLDLGKPDLRVRLPEWRQFDAHCCNCWRGRYGASGGGSVGDTSGGCRIFVGHDETGGCERTVVDHVGVTNVVNGLLSTLRSRLFAIRIQNAD